MNQPPPALLLDPKSFRNQPANDRSSSQNRSTPPTRREPGASAAPAGTTFDPGQLLNPRAAAQSRNSSRTPRSIASAKSSDPASNVTDDSEVSVLSDSDNHQATANEKDVASAGTQSSMIEDMYGVEQRRHHPPKRIKLGGREQDGTSGAATERPRQSRSSFLGEYMKGDTDSPAPTPQQAQTLAADTIDLTLENDEDEKIDDDDVIFVANKDLGSEEVCYGKVEGAKVYAHLVPKPPRSVLGNPSDWPSIRCELFREGPPGTKIQVMDPSNNIFGVIDPDVAGALAPLLDSPITKLRTQARLDVRRKKPQEWPGTPCSEIYRISINLYGPRKVAENIGRHLGQKNIWLGIPNAVDAGITVVNPHAERRATFVPNSATKRYSIASETRTAEEITSAVTKMFDHLRSAENLPEAEPPDLVTTPLLPHQKQGLWFMTEKEKPRRLGPNEKDNNSLWRMERRANGQMYYREIISGLVVADEPPQVYGGLLADMMGLGKTLSILSLVCSTLSEAAEWAETGPKDGTGLTNPTACPIKTTLLVVPLSTVGNWINQIRDHLKKDAISYYVFHGPNRTRDAKELSQYDVVITTYSTVLSDTTKRGHSPLSLVNFFRIVLDEAHTIREQSAAQSKAIFQLEALRRWSVTGTPIQNRLEDLGSVTRFLRLFPFNEKGQFAAHIVSGFKTENPGAIKTLSVLVDSFTLRRVKDRIDLPPRHDQTVMLNFSEQEQKLHEFFRKESNVMMNVIAGQDKQKIGGKMYHLVLKAMMILRQISAHGKELLDPEDRERFRGLTANDAIDLEELDDDTSGAADRKAYEMLALMKESSADMCAKCGNQIAVQSPDDAMGDKDAMAAAMLPCYDILCADCFYRIRHVFDDNANKPVQLKCTFCKGVIAPAYSKITTAGFEQYQSTQVATKQSRKQVKVLGQYEGPHTKTKALIEQLLNTVEESQQRSEGPPIKSVVFSSWTSHLDLIEIALEDNGLRGYTRLDGTMSLRNRNAALDAFRDKDDTTILLATLGAGGLGLNLTAASKVYVMEPQYNPAAVTQAVDRIHRLGQTREVTTVQFVMKGSIEEKILDLAKRKQKLADMSLNRSKSDKREMQEERMKEYRSLFK